MDNSLENYTNRYLAYFFFKYTSENISVPAKVCGSFHTKDYQL